MYEHCIFTIFVLFLELNSGGGGGGGDGGCLGYFIPTNSDGDTCCNSKHPLFDKK